MDSAMNEMFIRRAIQLAKQVHNAAREKGNHPFGSLLVDPTTKRVIIEAENTVSTDNDVTCHAERNLISKASRTIEPEVLHRSICYTSTEPCAMCSGAIYWASVRIVVYGCPAETLGKIAHSPEDHEEGAGGLVLPCREVFSRAGESTRVVGPILEEEAVVVHQGFWGRK